MAGKNDTKWIEHFEIYKEFMNEFYRFPTKQDECKGVKIGQWFWNQITAYKGGFLPPERAQMLDEFNVAWRGTKEEKQKVATDMLLNSNWKEKIPNGNHPIDQVFEDKALEICLRKDVYDLESFYENPVLKLEDYGITENQIIAPMIGNITGGQLSLLEAVFADYYGDREHPNHTYDEKKSFLKEFPALSISQEKTNEVFDKVLETLDSTLQKNILIMHFGLSGKRPCSLEEIASLNGTTRERMRQLEAKALRKFRHPSRHSMLKDRAIFENYGTVPETLKSLKTQSESICDRAVKIDGLALEYVQDEFKTPEICVSAVIDNGLALEFVPENLKTPEICSKAVNDKGLALEFVPENLKSFEIIMDAMSRNFDAKKFVTWTPELSYEVAKCAPGWGFEIIPDQYKTNELCRICAEGVKDYGLGFMYVPEEFKTPEICLAAVKEDGCALEFVPENLKTLEICREAVKENDLALQFVPRKFQPSENYGLDTMLTELFKLKKIEVNIEDLNLSVRAQNCLIGEGITTVSELLARPDWKESLQDIRNLGSKSREEIISNIKELFGSIYETDTSVIENKFRTSLLLGEIKYQPNESIPVEKEPAKKKSLVDQIHSAEQRLAIRTEETPQKHLSLEEKIALAAAKKKGPDGPGGRY